MFKKAAQQVRRVIEPFSGIGVVGRPGDIWIIESGIPAPPALLQNSEAYDGATPPDAITYDAAAHAVYVKLNAPRSEPPTTQWLTEADVKRDLGWSDSQFAAAKASGFPQSNGRRDRFDRDGIPAGSDPLWTSDSVKNWAANLRTLTVR